MVVMKKPWSIARSLHSSMAIVLGYEVYGDDCPRWVDWLHTQLCRLSDGIYWVQYRVQPKRQFHLIRTGLKPGYWDYDTRILHGCMAMLCDFVEWHGGVEELEKFNTELRTSGEANQQAATQETALQIYRWWKHEKPKEEKLHEQMCSDLYGPLCKISDEQVKSFRESYWILEKKMQDDEQAMLKRLIEIRPSLWT